MFSIVLPVYNAEKWIHFTLTSIQAQRYSNYEVIIVDDGSTDCSKDICQEFVSVDSRFRYFWEPNSGVSAARNLGLTKVTGDYLMFMDSDDYLSPDALDCLQKKVVETDCDLYFFGWNEIIDNRIVKHSFSRKELSSSQESIYKSIVFDPYKYGGGFPWNKLWKIKTLKQGNGFVKFNTNLKMYEDKLWVLENLDLIHSFAFCDSCIYNYRNLQGSSSHQSHNPVLMLKNAYHASEIIYSYIRVSHMSAIEVADKLRWCFLINYLFRSLLDSGFTPDNQLLWHILRDSKFHFVALKFYIKYIFCVLYFLIKRK
ncbi:glycosyltransferase family 2 protein [Bifidobacterium adolescentis]|uniref:glycosyltransferase family 2 protein n=1 Tax=Bifidobacterium adolescentis TaxID=1680 RepID=UPI003D07EFCB